ncbi:MAG: PEP-CTERM sorting domain-containing protein, partial [Planctomycetota bacterium]
KYGQWNDPDILVDVYFNEALVGNFLAEDGYISPGPRLRSFDVAGLLSDDTPEILFTGHGANTGDYVVGQVDLHYNIPEPAALLLFGLGGLVLRIRREPQTRPGDNGSCLPRIESCFLLSKWR